MNYSLIVPFYNEEENVLKLNEEITKIIHQLNSEKKRNFEIIYVDDGSLDNTFEKLKQTSRNKFKTIIIRHKKNLSQSSALFTGISFANYENLIFLDGDGQNDPLDLSKMLEVYETGYDMVNGWRKHRKDSYFSRTFPSKLANFFVRIFTQSKLHDHGCSLKILKKDIIDYKISWGDFHRLLSARISFDNWKVKEVEVNHRPRVFGKSKYNISRVFRVLIDLIYINLFRVAGRPTIYFFGKFGLWSFFGSILTFTYMIYNKVFNNMDLDSTPLPILVVFLIFMGFLFLFIGLLAQLIINSTLENNSIDKLIKEKIEN